MGYHVRYLKSQDGTSIAAARGGSGPTLVVSPAFGTSIETDWDTYEHAFPDHQLVTWDRRGWGLSERGTTGADAESYLGDAQAVVDGLGLERFAVVGTLMGSVEATALASRNPDRVDHLVLRNPVTGLADWAAIPGVAASLAALEHDWEYYTESFAQFVVGWGDPSGHQAALKLRAITTRAELQSLIGAFIELDLVPAYGQIAAATLVEHHPGYFFPDSYSRRIASMIDDCELTIYPGPGADFMGDFSATRAFLARDRSLDVLDSPGARTIMFTDIESSTAFTRRLGDRDAQELIRRHDVTVRRALSDHDGRQVKHTGDGIMASFVSAGDAVLAAVQVQREIAGDAIGIRIGLNTGEPIAEDGDLFGTAVQLAARITDHAAPGQILASNVVRELCAGKRFTFTPIDGVVLRGFPGATTLFEVDAPASTAADAPPGPTPPDAAP